MLRKMFEIFLAVMVALPLNMRAAEAAEQNPALSVKSTRAALSALAERIRLSRSVMEFAEEYSMFDSQLYGTLPDKTNNRQSILQLNEEIRSTNSKLGQAMYKMDMMTNGVAPGDGWYRDETPEEVAAEVENLESQLASMNDRLGELQNQGVLGGESEIMDGSLWEDFLECGSTMELLDLIDESLSAETGSDVTDGSARDK